MCERGRQRSRVLFCREERVHERQGALRDRVVRVSVSPNRFGGETWTDGSTKENSSARIFSATGSSWKRSFAKARSSPMTSFTRSGPAAASSRRRLLVVQQKSSASN